MHAIYWSIYWRKWRVLHFIFAGNWLRWKVTFLYGGSLWTTAVTLIMKLRGSLHFVSWVMIQTMSGSICFQVHDILIDENLVATGINKWVTAKLFLLLGLPLKFGLWNGEYDHHDQATFHLTVYVLRLFSRPPHFFGGWEVLRGCWWWFSLRYALWKVQTSVIFYIDCMIVEESECL